MNIFINFFEDYNLTINRIALDIQGRFPDARFNGIASRRKTSLATIDPAINIGNIDWLGDLEQSWLNEEISNADIEQFKALIGDEKLRHLISCDRDIGQGFMLNATYARSPLSIATNQRDDLKWRYVINICKYYHARFTRSAPKFVLFNEYTMAYELGAYYVARALGILALCINASRIGTGFQIVDNPFNVFTLSDVLFDKVMKGQTKPTAEALEQARTYLQTFRTEPQGPEYFIRAKQHSIQRSTYRQGLKILFKDLGKALAISMGLKGTKGFLRQRNGLDILKQDMKHWYYLRRALYKKGLYTSEQEIEGRNYAYYALHVEPEASVSVFNVKNTNQVAIIENIAKSLPVGWSLVVKEHFPNLGRRPRGFYNSLRNIPDVILVSPFANNLSLIRNAQINIPLSGTIGWESILFGRPTVVLGQSQYISLNEGFVKCPNPMDIYDKIMQAMDSKPVPDDTLITYIACIYQYLSPLPFSFYGAAHFGQSAPIDDPNIALGITKMVDQILEYIASR